MTDLTSTLASLQRLAEEVKRLGDLRAKATRGLALARATHDCDVTNRKSAPLLASAVLALVEVARAAQIVVNIDGADYGPIDDLQAALTRLSAPSPKEGE